MRLRSATIILLCLSGCGFLQHDDTRPDSQIRSDRTEYAVGETIELTVVNDLEEEVIFNLGCGPTVEEHRRRQWVNAGPFVCPAWEAPDIRLEPGETHRFTYGAARTGVFRYGVSVRTSADEPPSEQKWVSNRVLIVR